MLLTHLCGSLFKKLEVGIAGEKIFRQFGQSFLDTLIAASDASIPISAVPTLALQQVLYLSRKAIEDYVIFIRRCRNYEFK